MDNHNEGCAKGQISKLSSACTHSWTISNFASLTSQTDNEDYVESPNFSQYSEQHRKNIEWSLALYPNGCEKFCRGNICFYVYLESEFLDIDDFRLDCKLSVLGSNNVEYYSHYGYRDINSTADYMRALYCGFHNFAKLDDILEPSNKYIIDEKITFLCQIRILKKMVKYEEYNFKRRFQLLNNLESLFESKEHHDFLFIVKGKEFKVHKSILSARSPIFSSMFQHGVIEKNDNCEMKIRDIEPETFEEMLRYIYTGIVEDSLFAKELLAVGNKYAINGLKEECEEILIRNLTVENAIEILQLADIYEAHNLKCETIAFIVAYSGSIIDTNAFKNLSSSEVHLVKEIFCALAKEAKNDNNN